MDTGYLYLVATMTVILYTYFGYTLVHKYLFRTYFVLILLKISLGGIAEPYRSLFNINRIATTSCYGCSGKAMLEDIQGFFLWLGWYFS